MSANRTDRPPVQSESKNTVLFLICQQGLPKRHCGFLHLCKDKTIPIGQGQHSLIRWPVYGHDFKSVLQKCLCVHILAGSEQRRHWHIVPDAIYTRRINDGCALYTGGLVLQMGHRSRQPHIHWELAPGRTGNKLGTVTTVVLPWNFLLLLTKSLPRSSSGNSLFMQVWWKCRHMLPFAQSMCSERIWFPTYLS